MIVVVERFIQDKGLRPVETIGVWEAVPQNPSDAMGRRESGDNHNSALWAESVSTPNLGSTMITSFFLLGFNNIYSFELL